MPSSISFNKATQYTLFRNLLISSGKKQTNKKYIYMGRTSENVLFLLKIPVGLKIIFFLQVVLVYNVLLEKAEYGRRRKIKARPVGGINNLA